MKKTLIAIGHKSPLFSGWKKLNKQNVNYGVNHRVNHKDFRRIMFDKQEELLGELSQLWKERGHAEHQRILASHPFDDLTIDEKDS